MAWRPGQRRLGRAIESPYEGVPDHLRQPLWGWIEEGLASPWAGSSRLREVAIHLRIQLGGGTVSSQVKRFVDLCSEDDDFMLDLVEALLELYGWDERRAPALNELLVAANSAYVVNDTFDGLEERVAPGVRDVLSEAVEKAEGSAGDHLLTSWNSAYGRNVDAVKAYSEAIKAVEAALAPRVSPQNGRQTLGTMIRDIRAKPTKWKFVIAGTDTESVDALLHMMRLLWDGQTSRHGGVGPTRSETLAESRAAVHLAAALVQFGASGALDFP